MSKITWLAAYPKSGSTWLRILLTSYLAYDGRLPDISDLKIRGAANREIFDELMGIESSDLTPAEIARWRPDFYRQWAREATDRLLIRIHDALTRPVEGLPLIPKDATQGVVYLIRNPFDLAVSYAHHSSVPIDQIIGRMADSGWVPNRQQDHLESQFEQLLLSWSGHVLSWVDEPELACHVVRYEDILADPAAAFTAVLEFAGFPLQPARLQRAVEAASFQNLQRYEQEHGFSERPSGAARFFRQGKAGSWRQALNKDQINRIIADHGPVMARFGYLDAGGQILC